MPVHAFILVTSTSQQAARVAQDPTTSVSGSALLTIISIALGIVALLGTGYGLHQGWLFFREGNRASKEQAQILAELKTLLEGVRHDVVGARDSTENIRSQIIDVLLNDRQGRDVRQRAHEAKDELQ